MTIEYMTSLANANDYPVTRIKASPQYCASGNNLSTSTCLPFVNASCESLYFTNQGRTAFAVVAKALKALWLNKKIIGKVWLPAYHCPAMVQPFVVNSLPIRFYDVSQNLEPNFDEFRNNLSPNDAVVGVRYFGFECGLHQLSNIVKSTGALLIEDRAHSLIGPPSAGDVCIYSLPKFLPVESGGAFTVKTNSCIAEFVEVPFMELPRIHLASMYKVFKKVARLFGFDDKPANLFFNEKDSFRDLSSSTKRVVYSADYKLISDKRINNYDLLYSELSNNHSGEPLFKLNDRNVVPYMLPFLINDGEVFSRLRYCGIQILRWEVLAKTNSLIAGVYRKNLIQIPCHQELADKDLSRIIECLN